jgi:hypothetical protein
MTSPSQLTKLLEEARTGEDYYNRATLKEMIERLCKIIERMKIDFDHYAEFETTCYQVERPNTLADQALLDVERIAEDGK